MFYSEQKHQNKDKIQTSKQYQEKLHKHHLNSLHLLISFNKPNNQKQARGESG